MAVAGPSQISKEWISFAEGIVQSVIDKRPRAREEEITNFIKEIHRHMGVKVKFHKLDLSGIIYHSVRQLAKAHQFPRAHQPMEYLIIPLFLAIIEILRTVELGTLLLRNNLLQLPQIQILAPLFASLPLVNLDLSHNSISDTAAIFIGKTLSPSLKSLTISHSFSLTHRGVIALLKEIAARPELKLDTLDVQHGRFKEEVEPPYSFESEAWATEVAQLIRKTNIIFFPLDHPFRKHIQAALEDNFILLHFLVDVSLSDTPYIPQFHSQCERKSVEETQETTALLGHMASLKI